MPAAQALRKLAHMQFLPSTCTFIIPLLYQFVMFGEDCTTVPSIPCQKLLFLTFPLRLGKYPHLLHVKPSNEVFVYFHRCKTKIHVGFRLLLILIEVSFIIWTIRPSVFSISMEHVVDKFTLQLKKYVLIKFILLLSTAHVSNAKTGCWIVSKWSSRWGLWTLVSN